MKAHALECYPICFPEPGPEADTTPGGGEVSSSTLRPSVALPRGGHSGAGAWASAETRKGLGSGLVCRLTGLP